MKLYYIILMIKLELHKHIFFIIISSLKIKIYKKKIILKHNIFVCDSNSSSLVGLFLSLG